jgi:nucleoside-diphosphate-sugar epimerase
MNQQRYLITGATGFVGSHLAEACCVRGHAVVTLARPTSDITLLRQLGVEIIEGDLTDAGALRRAAEGAEVVIHCAARVGDWGPVDGFRQVNVEGLRNLLEALRGQLLRRFVQLSTLGVYPARHHHGTDETAPIPDRHMDGYTQSKFEAEKLVQHYHREHGLPAVILRPGFIYGPRDRTVLPRLMKALQQHQVRYLGNSKRAMNTIGVHNLVDAIFLAIESPDAVGQVYNLTDDEPVSKRQFMETIADLAQLDRPRGWVPLWVARSMAGIAERLCRLVGTREPPRLTMARLKFLGLNLDFSVAKAKRELGYRPRVRFADGMEEAVAWWKGQQGSATTDSRPEEIPSDIKEQERVNR